MIAIPSIQKVSFFLLFTFLAATSLIIITNQVKKRKQQGQRIQKVENAPLEASLIATQEEMKPALYVYYDYKPNTLNLIDTTKALLLWVDTLTAPTDYHSKNFIKVYLINQTANPAYVPTQERSFIMIQEALNEEKQWQPIEYWNYDWGQGIRQDSLILPPNYAVMTSAPRYKGGFVTQVRFKLKIAKEGKNKYLYSYPFSATIDKAQFNPVQNPIGNKASISLLDEAKN